MRKNRDGRFARDPAPQPGSQPSGAISKPVNSNAGAYGAADERPRAEAFGLLPHALRHHRLRLLAGQDVGAERDVLLALAGRQRQRQRRAGVMVPHLHRIHLVPARNDAGRQQVVDRRGARPAVDLGRIAERLAEKAAFGMRRQAKPLHHLLHTEAQIGFRHDRLPPLRKTADRIARPGDSRARHASCRWPILPTPSEAVLPPSYLREHLVGRRPG